MYHALLLVAPLLVGQVSALFVSPVGHSARPRPRSRTRRPAHLASIAESALPAHVDEEAAEEVPDRRVVLARPSAKELALSSSELGNSSTPVVAGVGNSSAVIIARTAPWNPWVTVSAGRLQNNGWISRVRQWSERNPMDQGIRNFFLSAVRFEWAVFAAFLLCYVGLHTYLFDWPSRRTYHALALFIWLGAASLYNLVIWYRLGSYSGKTWFVGYILELIFSIENVFIYHIVIEAFQVPRKPAQKALFVVICFQMAFQMVFFMGLANWLRSIYVLPYILGAWLVYVGAEAAREGQHASFDGKESFVFRVCRWLLGSRLSRTYRDDNSVVFTDESGRTKFTLLLPAIGALLLVDFIMEVDVTLTKIAEIRNPYMGFTSSVAAAFAVPELFFVARDMFKRFALLKYGVSFVLLFFGGQLLLHRWVHIPEMVGIAVIAVVLAICVLLSVVLSQNASLKSRREEFTTDDSEVERQAAKQDTRSEDRLPAEVRPDTARLPVFPAPRTPRAFG